jgi:hypothetical protein
MGLIGTNFKAIMLLRKKTIRATEHIEMTSRHDVPQQLSDKRKKRKTEQDVMADATEEGWKILDNKTESLELLPAALTSLPFSFKFRTDANTPRLTFFLLQITEKLVEDVLKALPKETWYLAPGHVVSSTKNDVYKYMAMYVYMQGNSPRPDPRYHSLRPLRNAYKACQEYFKEKFPEWDPPAIKYMEMFIARFHITSDFFEDLSKNMQDMVKELGAFVAADEKLYEFVGNSPYVIKKKGKLGFWMYELVCCLPNGAPFLIHFKMWHVDKVRGQSQPVVDIVKLWLNVLYSLSRGHGLTICVADSYYFSAASIAEIFGPAFARFIKFVLATTEHKYKLCEVLKLRVNLKGKYKAMFNTKTGQSFVHYYDPEHDRKYVLTNAFAYKKKKQKVGEIPVSDFYSTTFGRADNFNSNLTGKAWQFKHGGYHASGETGHSHDFAFSSVLQNTFNGFESVRNIERNTVSFRDHCTVLAEELYAFAHLP